MALTQTQVDQQELQALHSGAALLQRPGHGLLRLADADRVDFVQRITTNNLVKLQPGQATVTVLTSPVARIQYLFTVAQRGEDLWLLPAGEEADQLSRYLRSQIFFMDKVKVENLSGHVRRMRLMGSGAAAVLQRADLPAPPPETFAETEGSLILHQERFDVPGYELVLPGAEAEAIRDRLISAGALLLADDASYHVRRVELGRPAVGHELTEEYNPLEAGLAWTCAEDKGCYTGQEIIARQITYDKVTKSLVGLRSQDPLPAGAEVKAEGRAAGTITSSVYSPTLKSPLALAVIKRPHNTPGATVEVEGQAATVEQLPFKSSP
jgi:tRNA-modifying protein YgfZ